MSLLPTDVYYGPGLPIWLKNPISSILVSSGTIQNLTVNNIQFPYQSLSSVSTALLLNGVPIATISNISSLSLWSLDPAISTVRINNNNMTGISTFFAQTGFTSSLNTTNLLATNIITSNLAAYNIVNFYSTSIETFTSTLISEIDLARISSAQIGVEFVSSASISSLSVIAGNAKSLSISSLSVSTGNVILSNATIADLSVTNSASFAGSRPNFTTGINTSGPNNFNNTTLDNVGRITANTVFIGTSNYLNIQTSSFTTILNDRGADVGGSSQINLTAQYGQNTQVNITAGEASRLSPTPYSQVNIAANGSIGVAQNGVGGRINITADSRSGSGCNYIGYGEIDIIANSAGIYPGTLKEAAGTILAYSGLTTPSVGLPGCGFYSALVCLSLTAGVSPTTASYPGFVYIRGDSGTKIQNSLYVDNINNISLYDLNIASKSADISNRNINIDSGFDLKLTSSNGGQIYLNGAVYPPASGAGVWASTATSALNMAGYNINNLITLQAYSGYDLQIIATGRSIQFFASNLQIVGGDGIIMSNTNITDLGSLTMHSGGNINMSGGNISNLGNITGSNTSITTGGNLTLGSSTGGSVNINSPTNVSSITVSSINGSSYPQVLPSTVYISTFNELATSTLKGNPNYLALYANRDINIITTNNINATTKNFGVSASSIGLTASTITLTAPTSGSININNRVFTTNASNWTNGTVNTLYGSEVLAGKYIQWCYDNSPAGTGIYDNCNMLLSAPNISIAGNVNVNSNRISNVCNIAFLSGDINSGSNFTDIHGGGAGTYLSLINGGSYYTIDTTGNTLINSSNVAGITASNNIFLSACNSYVELIAGGGNSNIYFTGAFMEFRGNMGFTGSNKYIGNLAHIYGDTNAGGGGLTIDYMYGLFFNSAGHNANFYVDSNNLNMNNYVSGINIGNYCSNGAGNVSLYSASNEIYLSTGPNHDININGGRYVSINAAQNGGSFGIYASTINSATIQDTNFGVGGNYNLTGGGASKYITITNYGTSIQWAGPNIYVGTSSNGGFNFNLPVAFGSAYSLNMQSAPICNVSNIYFNNGPYIRSEIPGGYTNPFLNIFGAGGDGQLRLINGSAEIALRGNSDLGITPTTGHNIVLNGQVVVNSNLFLNNNTLYNAFELYNNNTDLLLTGIGRNIILHTYAGGGIYLNGPTTVNDNLNLGGCNITNVASIDGASAFLTITGYYGITMSNSVGSLIRFNTNGSILLSATGAVSTIDVVGTLNLNNNTITNVGNINMNTAGTSVIDVKDGYICNVHYMTNPFTTIIQANAGLYLYSSNVVDITGATTIHGNLFLQNNYISDVSAISNLSSIQNNSLAVNFNVNAPSTIISGTVQRNLTGSNITQPIIQYGTATGTGASGSVTVALPQPYTSGTSYIATASMMDVDPARISVNRNNLSSITIYWFQAGSGTQTLGWNTMGT